jgi:hypothetical protein
MRGRTYAALLAAGAVVLAACSERSNDGPTSPEFAGTKIGCNFTNVSQLTKTEFGNSSAEAGYALDMKNAGAGTDAGTYSGYQILQSLGNKFDDGQTATNSLSTDNAPALAVALLECMNLGGATIPAATVFGSALQYTGAFAVRGLGTEADQSPVKSHDGAWLLEPPGHPGGTAWEYDQSWQGITSLKKNDGSALTFGDARLADAMLVYGQPVTNSAFSDDVQKSTIFNWSTIPAANFDESKGGVVIGECTVESNFLQHNPKSSPDVQVLGFLKSSCYDDGIAMLESAPRNFAQRVFRFFSPSPAYAALATTTGSAGSKGSLSPFEVIFPGKTVLARGFNWSKSGNTVNAPFTPTVTYRVTTLKGTPFLQSYILVWLEATNNQGVKVAICDNWDYTNADGVASFPKAYLNKAGGYTITTRTAGALTLTPLGGSEITVPFVPPSDAQNSPLVNVKNDVTKMPPDACPSFGGDITNPPEAPGPNGL